METIIAVDAMGSDRAPRPEIEGALLAVRHYPGVKVFLVGPEEGRFDLLVVLVHPRVPYHANYRINGPSLAAKSPVKRLFARPA